MAERERRGRSRRDGGRIFRRLSAEGKDEDWIAELRHDIADDAADGRPGAEAPGPALYDARADVGAPAQATPPPAPPPPAAADDPWQVFADVLDAQQATLVALAERVDAVEARLDAALRRQPPAAGSRPGGPRPDAPTMREVVDALRASAVDSAARLGREVARRRR